MKLMNSAVFSASEAMGLLGKEVQSIRQLGELPEGTPGRIIEVRRDTETGTGFHVAVLWQLPSQSKKETFTKAEFQRLLTDRVNQ